MQVLIQWTLKLVCLLWLIQVPMSLAAVSLPFKLVPAFIPLEPAAGANGAAVVGGASDTQSGYLDR